MGLFKKRKSYRGSKVGATGTQQLKRLEARWLRKLEKMNPYKFDQLMGQRMGLPPEKDESELAVTLKTLTGLQKAGLIQNPAELGGGFDWKGVLEGLAGLGAAAPAIVQHLQQMGQGRQDVQVAVQPQGQIAQPQGGGGPAAEAAPQEGKVPLSIVSSFLIAKIQNPITKKVKSPSEVADLLMEHYHDDALPLVKELVNGMVETPNEEMGDFIKVYAGAHPEMYGLLAWLSERQEYFRDCILAVRERAASTKITPIRGERVMGI